MSGERYRLGLYTQGARAALARKSLQPAEQLQLNHQPTLRVREFGVV